MGLFPSKNERVCAICGKRCGINSWIRTKDKRIICRDCMKKAKLPIMEGGAGGFTLNQIRDRLDNIQRSNEIMRDFTVTREVKNYLKVDDYSKQWYLASGKNKKTKIIRNFSDVISVEIAEKGVTECEILQLKILLRNSTNPLAIIDFIGLSPCKRSSLTYSMANNDAIACESIFKQIIDENRQEERFRAEVCKTPESVGATGVADEIRDLAELLEDGYITQEEFDARKKKLLNL